MEVKIFIRFSSELFLISFLVWSLWLFVHTRELCLEPLRFRWFLMLQQFFIGCHNNDAGTVYYVEGVPNNSLSSVYKEYDMN